MKRDSLVTACDNLYDIFENGSKKKKSVLGKDGCDLFDYDHTDPVVKQFKMFAKFLNIMLCRFDPRHGTIRRILSNGVIGTAVVIAIYSAVYDLSFALRDCHHKSAPTSFVMFVWILQSVISMLFLCYWQKSMLFEKFFHLRKHIQLDIQKYDKNIRSSVRGTSIRFLSIVVFCVLNNFVYGFVTFNGFENDIIHPSYKYLFYFKQLRYLRLLQWLFCLTSWNIALHTYICLTNAMYWEVKKFNRKTKELRFTDEDSMTDSLVYLMRTYSQMNRCIREMDRIFTKYAFLMMATIIPTSLFTMLMMASRRTPLDIILAFPSVSFCLYGFYGLTMTPAKLHEEIFKSRSHLFMNDNIWVPYKEKVNKIGRTLAMHLDQTDLGISIWGFAMVTKPLILTTFSALITCLALLLQVNHSGSSLGTDDMTNRTTVIH